MQLDAAIEVRGLFDRRGKLRVAWLQQLQSLINTAKGIDSLLSLDRREKAVPRLSNISRLEVRRGEAVTIIEALRDPQLFGGLPAFRDLSTWKSWLVYRHRGGVGLHAIYALSELDPLRRDRPGIASSAWCIGRTRRQ